MLNGTEVRNMNRVLVIGTIAALTLGLLLDGRQGEGRQESRMNPASVMYASSQQKANQGRGPCSEERWLRITPAEWTPQLVKGLIRCSARRWPVDGGAPKLIAVASCESGLYVNAIGGDNLGIFQHKASLWFDRTSTYLRSRWFNNAQWARVHQAASVSHPQPAFVARANVIIAVRMIHNGGYGPWSCA